MMKTVLVFKTSVTDPHTAHKLKPILDNLMDERERWNFDLEDIDNILRVEAVSLRASVIIERLRHSGVDCVELED